MKLYHFYFLLFYLFSVTTAPAQILNDSTQNVYGTKTTKVFNEDDFLRGSYNMRSVDTSLTNMHQSRNWYHDTTFHQDLGNVGTAAKPILWRFPQRIGVRLGKNVFERYAYDPYGIDYFDTKSPYTHLFYVQGQQGEQVFEAKHSRSIKNISNIGFAFERMSGNKQLGAAFKETQVQHTGFVLFSHVQNKTGKYHLFTNFIKFDHDVAESGGIKIGANADQDSLYLYQDAPIWLRQAANEEKRNSFHLTHFYTLAKEYIKVFQTVDFRHQYNQYFDTQLNSADRRSAPPLLYPEYRTDANKTNDRSTYRELENIVGITGNHPLFFYKLYAKRRDARIKLTTDTSVTTPADSAWVYESFSRKYGQNFLGGETQFRLKDIFNITVKAEYQLFRDYLAIASGRVKFFTFSQSRSSYSPTIIQQHMVSNHFSWNNSNFDNVVVDRTAASVQGKFWRNTLTAEIARVNLQNYVFYNTFAEPQQLNKQLSFYTAFVHHHLTLRNFHADHVLTYNYLNNAAEIRMPDWLVNSRIYYQGALFKNALFGQIGIETYVTDDYYADAYMPVTQQFYLQNTFKVPSFNVTEVPYPVVDLFLSADIKSFNGFVKLSHINQGFPRAGYFQTPYYPGIGRSLVFGIKWMFFD